MSTPFERFDQQLVELQKLKFDKRECPGCGGLLETPKPLKPMACPACRAGKIVPRKTDERWCPVCRSGALKTINNVSPIKICPLCSHGRLKIGGLIRNRINCASCNASFAKKGNQLTLIDKGRSKKVELPEECSGDSDSFWLPMSGRAKKVVQCETCSAQWDEHADGSMHLFHWVEDPFGVARKYESLTKAEWARVGLRLKPDAGNATCSKCDADYLLEDNEIVPLHVEHDPYGFIAEFRGCRIDLESLRFLGVYKTSGKPGPVCAECRTEFDAEGDYLRLRASNHEALANYTDQAKPMEDWHRIAKGLPAIDEEADWRTAFDDALRRALLTGDIPWADRKKTDVLWRSDAELESPRAQGRLLLFKDRLEFQNRKHGWTAPLDVVRQIDVTEEAVNLSIVGYPEPQSLYIHPETVAVELRSGKRQVVLDGSDFAEALRLVKNV